MDTEAVQETKKGFYSPLFPGAKDKHGRPIYAGDMREIVISRCFIGSQNRSRRITVSMREFEIPDEDRGFVIIPATTTEHDLEEQFGGGEYWIQPMDHEGDLMSCGRTLFLPGPMKEGVREAYLQQEKMRAKKKSVFARDAEDQDDGRDREREERDDVMREVMERLERIETSKRTDDPIEAAQRINAIAGQMGNTAARDSLVDELREELDELRKNHRIELDRKAEDFSELRKRSTKDLDEARDDWSAKRRGYEREIDDMRDRLKKDAEETRKRYEGQITELQKRVSDLMTENMDLRRDLADSPVGNDEPPPPVAPDSPWWMRDIGAPLMKAVSEQMSSRQQAAAAQQQANGLPTQQSQPQAQYIPPQPVFTTSRTESVPPAEPVHPASEPTPASAPASAPVEPTRPRFVYGRSITVDSAQVNQPNQAEPQEASGGWENTPIGP